MSKLTKGEFLDKCLKTTKEFAIYNEYEQEKSIKELTEEQKKSYALAQVINNGFGCERENVRKLIELITELPIPFAAIKDNESAAFKKFACFVVLETVNGNDYVGHGVIMATGAKPESHFRSAMRSLGNSLTGCRSVIRPATEEEITDFVNNQYGYLIERSII